MPVPARLVSAADWIAGLICITDWLASSLLTSSLFADLETRLVERVIGFAAAALLWRVVAYTKRKETDHES